MLYHHMHKISKHHAIGMAVIFAALAFLAFLYPRIIFAQGVFGGRIQSIIPDTTGPCGAYINVITTRGGFQTVCRSASVLRQVRPCVPGRYMLGFVFGNAVKAWCG